MFRDLKEYQTIQKIYEEQILKSPHEDLIVEAFQSEEFTAEEIDYVVNNIDQLCNENLLSEENNDLNEVLGKVVKNVVQKVAPKLVNTAQKAGKAVASGIDKASPAVKNVASSASKKFGSALGKVKAGLSRAGQAVSNQVDKAKPILKKGLDTAKKVVPAVGALAGAAAVGKKIMSGRTAKAETQKPEGANVDTSSEIESSEQSAKVETAPERRKLTGKERAQAMARKRIGSGTAKNPDTTIAQANKNNKDAMRARAKAKFEAFKKRRAEKKLDKQRDFDDPDKRMNRGESYTPYDIVLEYLLSTEQAATIEEANYIMTEMDAKTIQSIVSE